MFGYPRNNSTAALIPVAMPWRTSAIYLPDMENSKMTWSTSAVWVPADFPGCPRKERTLVRKGGHFRRTSKLHGIASMPCERDYKRSTKVSISHWWQELNGIDVVNVVCPHLIKNLLSLAVCPMLDWVSSFRIYLQWEDRLRTERLVITKTFPLLPSHQHPPFFEYASFWRKHVDLLWEWFRVLNYLQVKSTLNKLQFRPIERASICKD